MQKPLIAATIALAFICNNAFAGLADCVVKVGGCSGVCVDPSGIVLTAKHCEMKEIETVRFPNHPPIEGRRIYVDELAEGVVAFEIDGDGWAFAPVADSPPNAGDVVQSGGYPQVARGEQRWVKGTVVKGGVHEYTVNKFPQGKFRANTTDFRTGPGWSGGPLFNERREVIGILSAGDNRSSVYISFVATRKAYDYAIRQVTAARESLLVFGYEPCEPCERFKRDLEAGRFAAYDVEYVDVLTPEGEQRYNELVAALEKATGKKQPQGFPAFHLAGRASLHVGYQRQVGLNRLLNWGRETLRLPVTLIDSITGTPSGVALPLPGFGKSKSAEEPAEIVQQQPELQEAEEPKLPVETPESPIAAILMASGAAILELLANRRKVAV